MRIRLIDFDEHALVLTVAHTGGVMIANPRMCDSAAAEMLRNIADQLDAAHPPYPCSPGAGPDPQHDHAEPLNGAAGRLDTERKVWTDGTGHTWDLSGRWAAAATEVEWEWTGRLDHLGTPVMSAVGSPEVHESLDVLRTLYGPISPAIGGRS
ncbi:MULTISPECIES: phiSA1p31-related protein [unclassified Streptomyces]|uniref:phiSA1p31-related protein n=1 Tax=unclassified Streptomyces TaxID=2593676 RepID=UPI003425F7F7